MPKPKPTSRFWLGKIDKIFIPKKIHIINLFKTQLKYLFQLSSKTHNVYPNCCQLLDYMTKNLPSQDLHHWYRCHRLVGNSNPMIIEKDLQIPPQPCMSILKPASHLLALVGTKGRTLAPRSVNGLLGSHHYPCHPPSQNAKLVDGDAC